jgi:hypothetical protein
MSLQVHKQEIFYLSSILVFPKQRRSTCVSMVVSLTFYQWDLSCHHLTLTPFSSNLSSVEEVFLNCLKFAATVQKCPPSPIPQKKFSNVKVIDPKKWLKLTSKFRRSIFMDKIKRKKLIKNSTVFRSVFQEKKWSESIENYWKLRKNVTMHLLKIIKHK